MIRHDDFKTQSDERRPDEREPRARAVAPPIEREHQTQAGIFEEDERRERERERR